MATQPLTHPDDMNLLSSVENGTEEGWLDQIFWEKSLQVYFQPIVALRDGVTVGFEAFVRGPICSGLSSSDALFTAAKGVGREPELAYQAMISSLNELHRIPPSQFLALNLSAPFFVSKQLLELMNLCSYASGQIVLVLNGHASYVDIKAVSERIKLVQAMGYRVVLDDAGDESTDFARALALRPDMLRLGLTAVSHLLSKPVGQAQHRILLDEQRERGMTVMAQGIEHPEDRQVLSNLGIALGQGSGIGKPVSAEQHLLT